MAVIKKTLFPKNLSNYSVLINDTDPNSRYFKISELPDTFTGGKNAFLIAGSEELVPDTKIQIELKDSAGNIIYHEPGEGMISSSINGESFVTEYYEGVSKVVAVYIYPDTAYGPCTLTILGELSQYVDTNGINQIIPSEWENKYNVKWEKQINVNPSLANTTKIRFYRRPEATITEILSPIYRIESGSKVNSGVSQSFADIKLSQLETFAGDVKRVKVFRTSLGDISDYDLIQDILVESKELLTSYGLSGSVVGQTGTFTSETLQNYWNTGSLQSELTSSRIESGVKLSGSGYFTYTQSLDIKSGNTYELNLDAFYSSSTSSNLGIYLSYVSQSTTFTSSIGTLYGTQPTKNLTDTVIPFQIPQNYPSASLYFSQSEGEWHLGNISLALSQDTAFSPDEISFITTMPTIIGNETFNFKFEFYDVNNNYVPVAVTQSANFTGGNANQILRSLTFDSDRNAFRFFTGSIGNPVFQQIAFTVTRVNLTGSVTYNRSVFDLTGSYIDPSVYASAPGGPYPYPGEPTNPGENGFIAHIDEFTGSLSNITVGSITYTASCDGLHQHETIYRFEDGDNAPGVFVTANANQFIYKATDLSLNPAGQVITIEAKRKNLASADTPLTVNSGSGTPPLTYVSTNTTNGVDTYTLAGTSYPYLTGETIYSISGSDQFGNEFSDAIKISPVKILDGFSVAVTNENTSFPAYSTGTVFGGFAASSGSINVKVGSEVINYSSTFITNSFSASISSYSGLTPNTFNGTDYSINELSADSGSLTLLIKYKDGGGTIISSSKEITYSKAKAARPVVLVTATPQAQSVVANPTGTQTGTLSNVIVSALEGNTSRFTSMAGTYGGFSTNPTITGNQLNMTGSVIDSTKTEASASLVVTHTDSEGTSGQTQTIVVRASKVNVGQDGASGSNAVVINVSPSSQTVGLSPTGSYGTPAAFTLRVLENGTPLTYVSGSGALSNSNFTIGTTLTNGSTSAVNGATSVSITPTKPTTTAGITTSFSVTYKDSKGNTSTAIPQTHIVSVTLDGSTGPGIVFTGPWDTNRLYQYDILNGRRDAVLYNDVYYATLQPTTLATDTPDVATAYWQSLGSEDFFVSAKIAIFEESFVQNTINVGTNNNGSSSSANITLRGGTANPYISVGQSAVAGSQGYGVDGVFLGMDSSVSKFSLVNGSTSYLKWNGTSLDIKGSITVTGGDAATNTNLSSSLNAKVSNTQTASLVNPTSYSFGPAGDVGFDLVSISPGSTAGLYIGSTHLGYHDGTNWKTYMQNNGYFYLAGSGNNGLTWNGATLAVDGQITARTGYIGNGTSGFTINSTYFRNGTKTSYNSGGTGIYVGTDGIGLGTTFTVSAAGALTATSATITGTINATDITATTAGNIAGWGISSNVLGTSRLKLNSSRPALEIYDTAGDIVVDISTGAQLSDKSAGSISPSPSALSTTSQLSNVTYNSRYNYTAEYSDNETYLGSSSSTFTIPGGSALIGKTCAVNATLGGTNALTFICSGDDSVPSVSVTNMRIDCQLGFKLVAPNGTVTYGFQNQSAEDTTTHLGSVTLYLTPSGRVSTSVILQAGTYTITPYVGNLLATATLNSTSLNPAQFSFTVSSPSLSSIGAAVPVSKTEMIAGGFQVVYDTERYISIPRANNADFVTIGGGLTCTGDVTANTSDARLKENIKIIENPLEKIENIRGVYFNYTNEAQLKTGYRNGEQQIGFIAQEVEKVLPHIVKPAPFDKDQSTGQSISGENYLTIQYEKIVPLLLEGIKELKKEIEELKKSK